jgi:outer membrane protein OmpA-like peptidoglycan-associated protein/tetratricopeptide (TPR) repeat protein
MKQLVYIFFFTLLSGFPILNAQKDQVREDFYDAEFFLLEEEYNEALYSFQKVYNAGFKENANINYRMGVCFSNIPGQKDKAIPYLEFAVKNISEKYNEGNFNEVFAPFDAMLYLGNAYRINNQLDKAIDSYNTYMKISPKLSVAETEYTKQQIESCKRAKEVIKNPSPILKENLGKSYNSSLNNFNAVYSGDQGSMAFMTAQKFYDAVYFVKKVNGEWTNSINVTPQIESDGNQYVCSLSFDGSRLFLTRLDNFDADIMVSEYNMGRWNPSKPIGKTINTKFFESHASMSPDGKTIYFTSNRTGGKGGMDIYSTELSETGEWSEPVNLGDQINTSLNEETPFISADGKTLFFSSQGHLTIGGYDVFSSEILPDKTWSKPVTMPYPINSTDDELFFFPDVKKSGGYMTLYDVNGFGDGDLYYLRVLSEEEVQQSLQALNKPEITPEPVKQEVTEEKTIPAEEKIPAPNFNIKPVFFGFDSYSLSDAAKEKLDELTKALNEYPLLKIDIRGYTDAMGPYEYNQMLSEKRAKAVSDYLITGGISPDRLKISGFSESGNIAVNSFPDGRDALEGRKFNRRVEFRALELGGALLIIEEIAVPEQLKVE